MSNREQIGYVTCCSTENIMSPKGPSSRTATVKKWVESKLARNWVESYLRAALEVDGQKMPWRIGTAREAIAVRLKDLKGNSDHHAERHEMQSALATLTRLENEASLCPTQPPLSGASPDVDRAKRPPLVTPSHATEELKSGDRVEHLGNFGRPTGEIGTVERTNEDDAVVKWDDDGRVRVGQPWLKRLEFSAAMPERNFKIILWFGGKVPSMATCIECDNKFITPNTLKTDRAAAEVYLIEKYCMHQCRPEGLARPPDMRSRMR